MPSRLSLALFERLPAFTEALVSVAEVWSHKDYDDDYRYSISLMIIRMGATVRLVAMSVFSPYDTSKSHASGCENRSLAKMP